MGGLEAFLMHRVDAARRLARTPAQAAEAQGRLFVAKRCHEALKAHLDLAASLAAILDELVRDLPEAAHEGARREAETVERRLQRTR